LSIAIRFGKFGLDCFNTWRKIKITIATFVAILTKYVLAAQF
jgi:hypothetical protein